MFRFCAGLLRFTFVLLLGLLSYSVLAQEPTAPAARQAQPAAPPKPEQQPTDQAETKSDAQTKITPQQAEQLFRDVDTILDYASKDTSLPIKHGVKRRMASREEVVSYLHKNMDEDKDVQRLKRTELVLKKFGLLPKNFNL